MSPSRNIQKCMPCRADRKYIRFQDPDCGHGECCRYERAQSVHEPCRPTIDGEEACSTVSGRCAKPWRLPRRKLRYVSMQDSGYDDSTSQSLRFEDSDLSSSTMSAMSAVSTSSTCSSKSSPIVNPQTVPVEWSSQTDQLAIVRGDLELCRQEFQNLFRSCTQSEFKDICCAISCVYNSARPMSRDELAAAANLSSLGRDWQRCMQDEQWTQLDQWIHKCSSIFVEILDGKIDFLRPTITRMFLRSVRIPGIDISHKTLGMVCRNQIELHRFLARNGTARPDLIQAVQAMLPYVREFGDYHLRLASLKSIITIAPDDNRTDANDGFEMISAGTSKLSIREGKGDWMVVKQN